jgi:hypothetical protein
MRKDLLKVFQIIYHAYTIKFMFNLYTIQFMLQSLLNMVIENDLAKYSHYIIHALPFQLGGIISVAIF